MSALRQQRPPGDRRRGTKLDRQAAHLGYRESVARHRRARSVEVIAFTALRRRTVVDAWIDYEDGTGWKRRPAIIVQVTRRYVQVIACTSNLGTRRYRRGIRLQRIDQAGLERPTLALSSRVVTVPRSHVLAIRGECAMSDWDRIAATMHIPSA
jgi:hypothetical protein